MKKHRNPTASDQTQATVARTGTTLSEVLVSMLIMSIGVVSLAALFPISVLRTAQATQLTHSVFLRNNAEAAVESKGLLSNKQIYGLNLGADGQPGVAGVDDDNDGTVDNAGEAGWLGTDDKNLVLRIIDPLGVQFVGTPTQIQLVIGVGTPLGGVDRTDGLSLPPLLNPTNNELADRLADRLALSETLAALPDSWSLVLEEAVTGTNILGADGYPGVAGVDDDNDGTVDNESETGWLGTDDLGASPPTITVANPTTGLNVRNNQFPLNAPHRMVMFNATGRRAVIQNLYQSQITGQKLSWWDVDGSGTPKASGPILPTGFTPTRVRIEVQDRRYTWMMTVRKSWIPSGPVLGADGRPGKPNEDDDRDGVADWSNPPTNTIPDYDELHASGSDEDQNWVAELDVAVFYNRSFKEADETAHTMTFDIDGDGFDGSPGVKGVDDDSNLPTGGAVDDNTERGWPSSDDNRTVVVSGYTAATKPFLKKGSYVLEPSQLKWYRILDLKDGSGPNKTVLLLDQDLQYPPTAGATLTLSGIFMKGIIEVYPLGSRTGRE